LLPNIPTKPPQVFTAKDPFVRNRIKGGEGAFDGNFFNLTIPIKPEEVNDLKRDQIKQNITKAVQEAFGNDQTSEDITVILPELSENDGKIFIKAPYVPAIKSSETPDATTTSIRPKLPRLDDNLEKQPIIKSTTRPTLQITTKDKPEFRVDPTFDRTTSVFRETTSTSTTLATPRTTSNIAQIKTTSRSSVSFELEDAITEPSVQPTISTTESFKRTGKPISSTYPTFASTRDSVSSVLPFEPSRRQPPTFIDPEFEPEYDPAIDPVLSRDEDEPIFDYLPIDENRIPIITPTVFVPKIPRREFEYEEDEYIEEEVLNSVAVDSNKVFDSRLNFLGGSSVDVVKATVVEDLNYARSVRESRASSIGIATISSITVGVIALLGFGLLIFMALARRRRRKYDTTAASSAALTPTQSRTTFSGTPVMVDTPSVSGGFGDDPLNTTGSSTIDPVVAIDGHQTIISSYNEFMSIPNDARHNIMNSLPSPNSSEEGFGPINPPPPPTVPSNPSGGIQRTRNLVESSPFLFAPNPASYGGQPMHYP